MEEVGGCLLGYFWATFSNDSKPFNHPADTSPGPINLARELSARNREAISVLAILGSLHEPREAGRPLGRAAEAEPSCVGGIITTLSIIWVGSAFTVLHIVVSTMRHQFVSISMYVQM